MQHSVLLAILEKSDRKCIHVCFKCLILMNTGSTMYGKGQESPFVEHQLYHAGENDKTDSPWNFPIYEVIYLDTLM